MINKVNNIKLNKSYNIILTPDLISTNILPILTHIIKIINTIGKPHNEQYTITDIISTMMFSSENGDSRIINVTFIINKYKVNLIAYRITSNTTWYIEDLYVSDLT